MNVNIMYDNVYGNKVKFNIDINVADLENSIMRIRYSLLNSIGSVEFIQFWKWILNLVFEPFLDLFFCFLEHFGLEHPS